MALLFSLLAMVGGLVQLVAAIFIYIHAFQRSVGTGFMVLCIPCYIFYYLHTEFEHPQKQTIMMAFYGGLALNVLGQGVNFALMPRRF